MEKKETEKIITCKKCTIEIYKRINHYRLCENCYGKYNIDNKFNKAQKIMMKKFILNINV